MNPQGTRISRKGVEDADQKNTRVTLLPRMMLGLMSIRIKSPQKKKQEQLSFYLSPFSHHLNLMKNKSAALSIIIIALTTLVQARGGHYSTAVSAQVAQCTTVCSITYNSDLQDCRATFPNPTDISDRNDCFLETSNTLEACAGECLPDEGDHEENNS